MGSNSKSVLNRRAGFLFLVLAAAGLFTVRGAFSQAPAAARTVDPAKGRPRSWRAMGRPPAVKPQGTEIAGTPARLAGVV